VVAWRVGGSPLKIRFRVEPDLGRIYHNRVAGQLRELATEIGLKAEGAGASETNGTENGFF